MNDALDATEAPVIFSHSCARAVADHVRNVPDDVLARVPANGGVVMVTFVPQFASRSVAAWWAPVWPQVLADPTATTLRRVREEHEKTAGPEPKATLADVADQIEHVRKIAGIDHVGLGGDYPATAGAPEGIEDVSKYPNLFAELIRRGWRDDELVKLAGGNLLRVMRRVEEVSRKLRATRPASIATIEAKDGNISGAAAVLDLEDALARALERGDQAALRRMLAPGFVRSQNDKILDRAAVLEAFASRDESITSARNEQMQLHDYGAAVAVTGWRIVIGRGAAGTFTRRFRYTDTWTRGTSGWMLAIAHDHLAPSPRPESGTEE